ncbi:MAG: ABC transporter ATP-binding protein [Egibacteraceae bacterium]
MGTDSVLACTGLTVGYAQTPILHHLDVHIEHDESVAVLGPSGSGKTTLLQTVAGFLVPWEGEIRIVGTLVASPTKVAPPERRSLGVVFQHYALWPHLSALDNVAYPIRRRGAATERARGEAGELLDLMGIGALGDRRPDELSGGQQQRVGLARALARRPDVYLFDEPTAHLDAPLRGALQEELAERRRQTGAGALYATHDAVEALAVADRVVLLRDGRVVQSGAPVEVYEQPVDLWAARLTGAASVLPTEALASMGQALETDPDGHAQVLIRPEWAALPGPLPGLVTQVWYRGAHTDYRLQTPAGDVVVRRAGGPCARVGERPGWALHRCWPV